MRVCVCAEQQDVPVHTFQINKQISHRDNRNPTAQTHSPSPSHFKIKHAYLNFPIVCKIYIPSGAVAPGTLSVPEKKQREK